VKVAPQHLLSISRILLGWFVFTELRASAASAAALPAVGLACAADYADGIVARRLRAETTAGRLLDNVCDVTFLALAFGGLAAAQFWTAAAAHGEWRWPGFDWLPLAALVGSFGSYLARWRAAHLRGATPRRSALGHRAGIANYALALVGAVEAHPHMELAPWLLGTAFVAVIALNAAAVVDNCRLLAREHGDALGRA
jgi:phosphatidylglycerophosphate synthase